MDLVYAWFSLCFCCCLCTICSPIHPLSLCQMVSDLRTVFRSGRTRAFEWRLQQLKGLLSLMEENQDKLCDALYKDLHKVSVT